MQTEYSLWTRDVESAILATVVFEPIATEARDREDSQPVSSVLPRDREQRRHHLVCEIGIDPLQASHLASGESKRDQRREV